MSTSTPSASAFQASHTIADRNINDQDDLDPAAFLKSVRELSEKREREDNERFRKLEQEVEKGRQERLARRAEYARSISPEKRIGSPATPTAASRAAIGYSPSSSNRASTSPMAQQGKPIGMESVPDFKGFGSARKSSNPVAIEERPLSATTIPPLSPSSPTTAARSSPSAAMPTRSGSMKWQQRPQSRGGTSRPLSMVAAENSASYLKKEASPERTREDIASALGSKDPSWFRQTADRGVGNAAYRKSKDEPTTSQRQGLPGMIDSRPTSNSQSDQISENSRDSLADGSDTSQRGSRTTSTMSDASVNTSRSSTSTIGLVQSQLNRGSNRSPSPTKDMGGFVQSAMLKRSDSINKRSSAQPSALGRAESIRSGHGGLQGSHSMPKLERPADTMTTDSLVRPLSNMDLTDKSTEVKSTHVRQGSVASMYTTNGDISTASAPSSPSKRWSPSKSSWIESALTSKQDARPPSPAKNVQPAWMANLAKAKADRGHSTTGSSVATMAEATPQRALQTPSFLTASNDPAEVRARPSSSQPVVQATEDDQPNALKIDLGTPVQRVESAPQVSPAPEDARDSLGGRLVPTKSTPTSVSKPKPTISPKPQIDFRSTLRSRAPAAAQPPDKPEFLARFGSLRKATTEKYVAPDVLKENILRGKTALSVTDGPQKSERRDEFKESLVAKKEEWRREKEDGIVHDRKVVPPTTPVKPEALAKRENLGRVEKISAPASPSKEESNTPEALKRHQSIRAQPAAAPQFALKSASKLASRMDSQLASMLARGPPALGSNARSQPGVVDGPTQVITRPTSEPSAEAGPLQDMRKGRAKGPKRRKAEATLDEALESKKTKAEDGESEASVMPADTVSAKPASTASIMLASLGEHGQQSPHVPPQAQSSPRTWPLTTAEQPQSSSMLPADSPSAQEHDKASPTKDVPIFAGFGKRAEGHTEDNKENRASDLSFLPSVRSAASAWSAESSKKSADRPPQIVLPSKKDEEAAMRSAGLLASASSPIDRPGGIARSPGRSEAPPRPQKSSAIISGQLQEASPNKELPQKPPHSEAYDALIKLFGSVPADVPSQSFAMPELTITADARRTLRREVYELDPETRTLRKLSGADEYSFYNQAVIVLQHVFASAKGVQSTEIFVWRGSSVPAVNVQIATERAKNMSRSSRAGDVHVIAQGRETMNLLQAVGGILVTRCGNRQDTSRSFLLCCRKHLGHIVLDEVDLNANMLCSAYAYILFSASRLFLWRGKCCSVEELSAGRLAAMDMSPNGQFEEVIDGEELPHFLQPLSNTHAAGFAYNSAILQQKEKDADHDWTVRLFSLQAEESRPGLFSSLFTRRPSWSARSPAEEELAPRLSVTEISPFTQEDLEEDGLYVLDAFTQIYVLLGPQYKSSDLAASRRSIFVQGLHFCTKYSRRCSEHRKSIAVGVQVVFNGIPDELRYLIRSWKDEGTTALPPGLIADSSMDQLRVESIALSDVLDMIQMQG